MTLAFLQIENLRNIKSARLNLHPHLNVIVGANGAGKTSLLEAIYLLSSGHSFRTREISPLISHKTERLTVFSRTHDEQSISIQKSSSAPTQVRINNFPCQTSSELAHFLPCQVFYQDLFDFIDAGPGVRRSLLDWGLFHVKPDYHTVWKNYRRALKQRNTLLRERAKTDLFEPWNKILANLAQELDELRMFYFESLNKQFLEILPQLSEQQSRLHYYKGWDKKNSQKSLFGILTDSYQSDLARQYTQYGAHQADLCIEMDDFKAKQHLSRGQQKIILFALKLAQIALLAKPCVFLCDDLPSELDNIHLSRLLELIKKTNSQFFITAIAEDPFARYFSENEYHKFRFEKGIVE